MSVKVRSIALLLSSLITGGGAWLGYELNKPRTVSDLMTWKGLILASEKDTHIWKALYFQHQSELTGKVAGADSLKSSCIKLAKEAIDYANKNYEYVEKYCINVLKSRKARILATGFKESEFLSSEDEYKTAFTINRYSEGFLALLGGSLTKESEIDEDDKNIYNRYKNYCESSLEEDSNKIATIQQVCAKHYYLTAEDMATQEGYKAKTKEELKQEWDKYKDENSSKDRQYLVGSTLLEDIKESQEDADSWIKLTKDVNAFTDRFDKWCSEQKGTKIYKKGFYKDTYPKYISRCMNKVGESKLRHPLSPSNK